MKPIICRGCNHRRGEHQNPLAVSRWNVGSCKKCECKEYKTNWIKNWMWYDSLYFIMHSIAILMLASWVSDDDNAYLILIPGGIMIGAILIYYKLTRRHVKIDNTESNG